jgi:hypothetical protein
MIDLTPPLLERIPRLKFAVELGVSPRTLDRWVKYGIRGVKLVALYIGYHTYFTRADWAAFQDALAEQRALPVGRTRLEERRDEAAEDERLRKSGLRW